MSIGTATPIRVNSRFLTRAKPDTFNHSTTPLFSTVHEFHQPNPHNCFGESVLPALHVIEGTCNVMTAGLAVPASG